MTMSDDFESRLREAMRQSASRAPAPANVEQRVLASTYGPPVRKVRPAWFLPVVNAAVVVLVVAAVLAGVFLVHSGSSKNKIVGPAVPVSTTPAPSAPPVTTPAPSPSSSAPPTVPVGAVPAGFVPYSATWVTADDGWVLGNAPCATAPCTSVVRTHDGGKTWQGIPAPVATLKRNSGADAQVSTIRFADTSNGWAFGSELFSTHDGGVSWVKQSLGADGSGTSVVALESGGGLTWAAVTDCGAGNGSCPGNVSVYWTPIGTDKWQRIGSPVSITNAFFAPQLVTHGSDWWLNVGAIYHGVGSGTPTKLATACSGAGADGLLATADALHLDVLCAGGGAAGSIGQQLVGTTDGGKHWSNAGPSFVGPTSITGIADNADGVLLLSESSGASEILRTTDDGQHFSTPLSPSNTGGLAWADLGFTTQLQASVILPGTSMYLSHDAGATWARLTF
jgi:hypothetical protein